MNDANEPPSSILDDSRGEIRSLRIRRGQLNLLLLLAVPFWLALAALATAGVVLGIERLSAMSIALGILAAAAVALLAWPIASTAFGRERLTVTSDEISLERRVGRLARTRHLPLPGLREATVQHLGVMAISPADTGWCLVLGAHRPYRSLIVAAGFGHDQAALEWVKQWVESSVENNRAA